MALILLLLQDLEDQEEIVVHLPDFDPVDVHHFINSIYGWREHKDDIFITQLHKFLQFGTGLIENGVKMDNLNKDEAPKVSPIEYCQVKYNYLDVSTPEMGSQENDVQELLKEDIKIEKELEFDVAVTDIADNGKIFYSLQSTIVCVCTMYASH